MTGRDFVRRQITKSEREKLQSLPSSSGLTELFAQKQPLNPNLTTLAGRTIGAIGLDLLSSSTSAVAINFLGGNGGKFSLDMIAGLDAALAAKATPLDISTAITSLVASSPATLDTLDELANALGDDPNFATTTATALGNRLRLDAGQMLTASQKTQGQTNLGVDPATLDARYNQLTQPLTETQLRRGLKAIDAGTVGDADTLTDAGRYFLLLGSTNVPGPGGEHWYIDVSAQSSNGIRQVATANNTTTRYERFKWFGAWTAWARVLSVQSELDDRFLKPTDNRDIQIQKTNNPALVIRALDATAAYLRLRNTVGFFDIANDPGGSLAINNYNADDTYQNTPLYFHNDGSPVFNLRPTYNGSPLATLAEATAGDGGIAGVSSFKGRTGTVTPQPGDYSSSQITHGSGSVSDVLSNGLLKAGGDMTGPLGLAGTGGNFFAAGTGDGATFSTYNMKLRGHWGMAMETYNGSVFGVYDFRTGTWDVKGGYKVNGVAVATEFDTLDGGAI